MEIASVISRSLYVDFQLSLVVLYFFLDLTKNAVCYSQMLVTMHKLNTCNNLGLLSIRCTGILNWKKKSSLKWFHFVNCLVNLLWRQLSWSIFLFSSIYQCRVTSITFRQFRAYMAMIICFRCGEKRVRYDTTHYIHAVHDLHLKHSCGSRLRTHTQCALEI